VVGVQDNSQGLTGYLWMEAHSSVCSTTKTEPPLCYFLHPRPLKCDFATSSPQKMECLAPPLEFGTSSFALANRMQQKRCAPPWSLGLKRPALLELCSATMKQTLPACCMVQQLPESNEAMVEMPVLSFPQSLAALTSTAKSSVKISRAWPRLR
jgi:hypothetical protein